MALAVGGTLLHPEIVTYKWIAIAAVAGTLLGIPLARVPLTAVPERTGLSQAFGGLAAALVGTAKYYSWLEHGELTLFRMAIVAGEVILGCLTCTGGLLAAAKLAEWMTTRPMTYKGQNIVSFILLAAATALGMWLTIDPHAVVGLPDHHRAGAHVRRPADSADRRRGHADRHLVPEFVRGPVGGRDGFRAREQAADCGRRARRRVRVRAVDHHVQGDESIGHQRALRRVRCRADTAAAAWNSAP